MHHRRPRVPAFVAATTTAALAGTVLLGVAPASATTPLSTTTTTAPTRTLPGSGQLSALASARPATVELAERQFTARTPAALRDQQPAWAPCTEDFFGPDLVAQGVLDVGLECARVSVPRDWNRPGAGEPLSIAISRAHRDGPRPQRTVLTNPGGPGGPGLSMATFGLLPALADTEVVGIDVRGTGASTTLTCGHDLVAAQVALPDPRDRSRAALDATAEAMADSARACQHDPLAPFVTTEQTVADLDLVRDALGRDTVDWVGYSGGSWLGAQYATYFPGRVGRFVLDSNVDVTSSWQQAFQRQPMAFQRRFEQDFSPWAARYGWLFHLGSDAAAVGRAYEEVRAGLALEPLQVPGVGAVTATVLDGFIAQAMYQKNSFESLAWSMTFLRAALLARGVGDFLGVRRAAVRAGDALEDFPPDQLPQVATFTTVTCNDTAWNRGQGFWDATGDELGQQHPLIGWSATSQPCGYYDRPALSLPRPDGRDLPPLLVVQSVHDPATPYEGALNTADALGSSRTITVEGEGDHGVYASAGSACVDGLVDAFLTTGAVPEGDVTCQGTGVPAPGSQLLDQVRALVQQSIGG